jgi:uncharacterized protein YdcH (DUF465 family)
LSVTGSIYFTRQWSIEALPLPIILSIVCILWFVFSLFEIKTSFSRTKTSESKNTIEEIYDDEIADFKFQKLLDSFNALDYRLVFILDELDKVSVNDLDNLIKEMKPYLLSGKAHFIIVAGQELAYRYLWAHSGDDAVIGSLFSKFYHIPLFSKDNLEEIGRRLINLDNAPPDAISSLSPLFDYLIFKSRRVPRSFIARFHQMVIWDINEKNEQTAYIVIPDKQSIELQVQTLAIIREIERLNITPKKYEDVLHDYLITQLFINAQQMIFKRDYLQTIEEHLGHYKESGQLADKAYFQNVEEIVIDLFTRMKQENIIKEKVAGKHDSSDTVNTTITTKPDNTSALELQKFKKDWINLKSMLNLFWNDEVRRNPSLAKSADTTYQFMEYFNSVKAVSFVPIHEKFLIDSINQPYLIEGEDRLKNFREQLRGYSINPLLFQRQITEYAIKQEFNSRLKENYTEQFIAGFDVAFVSRNSENPDLLIDFRHSESSESDTSDLEGMVEKLSNYNLLTKKGNYVLIAETFFNMNTAIDSSLQIHDFNALVESLNPAYYEKIAYYPIPVVNEIDSLYSLMRTITLKLKPYKEFSITATIEEKKKTIGSIKGYDYEDPQRFLWGQEPENNDRRLTAKVVPIGKDNIKFSIILEVQGSPQKPIRGFVYFAVHPTFPEEIYKVLAKNNSASIQLDGYEAFTVGAICDEGKTELELNLNTLTDIPKEFHYSDDSSNNQSSSGSISKRVKSVKKRTK